MSSKEYYKLWLKTKSLLRSVTQMDEDLEIQMKKGVGLKPQGFAITVFATLYSKYCIVFNMLCELYDLMTQIQRRDYIKSLIDTVTCRILEIKRQLQLVESLEYTYPDNALIQMLIIPQDIQILCPFFYSFEIRTKEMQYIVDEIMSGNRIGDPKPTESELERREEERLEMERIEQEERVAEIKRMEAMGLDPFAVEEVVVLTPEEQKQLERHNTIAMIQAMERARVVTKRNARQKHKADNLYLELAALKKPCADLTIQNKAANLIQSTLKMYRDIKREQKRDEMLQKKLEMIEYSYTPPSAKFRLEEVKKERRKFREMYFEKWMEANIKEKTRILRVHKENWIEDITSGVRGWFEDWYENLGFFDEYPFPEEGGSILIVRGDTMGVAEYKEWIIKEMKRRKEAAEHPKTKEEIKAEKAEAKAAAKLAKMEQLAREKKMDADYKKQRLKPESDPGVILKPPTTLDALKTAVSDYDEKWSKIDEYDPPLNVIQGHIEEMITEIKCREIWLELHPLADEIMIPQHQMLKAALKQDFLAAGLKELPITEKRTKPRKKKPPKVKLKRSIESMMQELFDNGIIVEGPKCNLEDFWGERNYAVADLRAIPWLPRFPPPCLGDVKEQFQHKSLLALGSNCHNVDRTLLIVGPPLSGKKLLSYALANETNSILFDLSPMNIYNKYPGAAGLKALSGLVTKVATFLQPAIILIDKIDKVFYKKVPKEEKPFDPTRLQKTLKKQILGPLKGSKVLIIGTATQPWNSRTALLKTCFTSVILIPRSDYGSICLTLQKILMKYHKVDRDFDFQSVAQVAQGYSIGSIINAVNKLLTVERLCRFSHDPLDPKEVLFAILQEEAPQISINDYENYKLWYQSYSDWPSKFEEYKVMLESQYAFKLKADKKKK